MLTLVYLKSEFVLIYDCPVVVFRAKLLLDREALESLLLGKWLDYADYFINARSFISLPVLKINGIRHIQGTYSYGKAFRVFLMG